MKNSKLTFSGFEGKEPLSRSQMRKITGGYFGSDGGDGCVVRCGILWEDSSSSEYICNDAALYGSCYFFACQGVPNISHCSCAVIYGGPECENYV